ncbi:MAG: PH domain-containing protein [Methanotrichaceae archaeon]|nr:PH domain-containing protein [Methanotrichaceae archaeon]
MSDAAAVERALKNLDCRDSWKKGYVEALPSILRDDEIPEKNVIGYYKDKGWLLMATNKRLVFVNLGLTSLNVEDLSYNKISSVQYSSGMFMSSVGHLEIIAGGNKAKISIKTKDLKPFAEHVQARVIEASTHANVPILSPTISHVDDPVRKLKQIKEMLDAGLINQAEYDSKKTELLSRM